MSSSSAALMEKGMRCLKEGLGDIESEEFIALVMRERFDYTKWRENLFDGMSVQEINEAAIEYERQNPFVRR